MLQEGHNCIVDVFAQAFLTFSYGRCLDVVVGVDLVVVVVLAAVDVFPLECLQTF